MKKVLFTLLLSLSFGAFAGSAVLTEKIVVPASAVGREEAALPIGELAGVKLCEAFDSPKKHVEVKAFVYDGVSSDPVWFGDVANGCTGLDVIPVPIALNEGANIKFDCKNFDLVERTCRVKAVVYTK